MLKKEITPPPNDIAAAPEGVALRVPLEEASSVSPVFLTRQGAVAYVKISDSLFHEKKIGDDIFHFLASALLREWGRVRHGQIHSRIGPDLQRTTDLPPSPGLYVLRLETCGNTDGEPSGHLWIFNGSGTLHAAAADIRLPRGEEETGGEGTAIIREHCRGVSIVELDAVAPFAYAALSGDETLRMQPMGERRRRSYLGARLACKFLSRSMAGGDRETPAESISTVLPGGAQPRCPLPDGSEPFRCSVSHDDRFAVAAADEGPIGIDVELLSDRILRLVPRFAGAEERRYVEAFPGGAVQAATRLWSVKEAAAKALDIRLPESWRGVRVTALGEHASEALFGGKRLHVYHGALDGHLLTLLKA